MRKKAIKAQKMDKKRIFWIKKRRDKGKTARNSAKFPQNSREKQAKID